MNQMVEDREEKSKQLLKSKKLLKVGTKLKQIIRRKQGMKKTYDKVQMLGDSHENFDLWYPIIINMKRLNHHLSYVNY